MIYTLALLYAGALALYAAVRWLLRRRKRSKVLDRWQKAVPHPSDPEAPKWTEAQCAALPGGHATVTRQRLGMLMRSCPRCGWWERERVEWRPDADFDVRR